MLNFKLESVCYSKYWCHGTEKSRKKTRWQKYSDEKKRSHFKENMLHSSTSGNVTLEGVIESEPLLPSLTSNMVNWSEILLGKTINPNKLKQNKSNFGLKLERKAERISQSQVEDHQTSIPIQSTSWIDPLCLCVNDTFCFHLQTVHTNSRVVWE